MHVSEAYAGQVLRIEFRRPGGLKPLILEQTLTCYPIHLFMTCSECRHQTFISLNKGDL